MNKLLLGIARLITGASVLLAFVFLLCFVMGAGVSLGWHLFGG